jgi:hypothetical protein
MTTTEDNYVQKYETLIPLLQTKSSYQWHSVLFHIIASILNNVEEISDLDVLNREFGRFVSTADIIIDLSFQNIDEFDLTSADKINLLYELLYNKIKSAEIYYFDIYIEFFTDFYQGTDDEPNFDKNLRNFLVDYMQGYSNDDDKGMTDRLDNNLEIPLIVQNWMLEIR